MANSKKEGDGAAVTRENAPTEPKPSPPSIKLKPGEALVEATSTTVTLSVGNQPTQKFRPGSPVAMRKGEAESVVARCGGHLVITRTR